MMGELVVGIAALAVVVIVGLLLFARGYVKVPAGQALLIRGSAGEPRVTFASAFLVPFVSHGELVDCSTKTIVVDRLGKDACRCKDKVRVAVGAEFRVHVNRTTDDVRKVAERLGAARTFDEAAMTTLLHGTFVQALAEVIGQIDYDELLAERDIVRDQVMELAGAGLDGLVLDEVAFVRLEQLPLEMLDPSDVHDAEAELRLRRG